MRTEHVDKDRVLIDECNPYLSSRKRTRARSLSTSAVLIDERMPYRRARSDQARRQLFRKLVYICIGVETREKEWDRRIPVFFQDNGVNFIGHRPLLSSNCEKLRHSPFKSSSLNQNSTDKDDLSKLSK